MWSSSSIVIFLNILFILMLSFCDCFLPYHRAVNNNDQPTSRCVSVGVSVSSLQCFSLCLQSCMFLYMISRDRDSGSCHCCPPHKTGTFTLNGTQWMTYLLNTCPSGYLLYTCTDVTSCLRFEETSVIYADANNACLLESAELIRMDSVEKYNVLKKLIVLTADISTAEAWIQGKKSNGIWEFHDGTQFPDFFCPTILTNGPRENRIRLKASDNFNCHDTHHDYKYGFVCEFFVNN